jgi:MoaA/NifB/PqqE/SkfB family radical SAM enzyme
LADEEIRDDSGQKFQLATSTFQQIQNSQHMQQLRQEFLAGQRPQTCRKCWNEERAGRTSKRMHTLDRLKHMIPNQDWTQDARPLMFLDLKLGNICNLKCRICGSWSSSQFAVEELADMDMSQDKKSSHPYMMLRAGSWPRDNPRFWQEIESVSDQIRYIEFTGGEPFMITEHFDMLAGLVDRGIAPQVEIHYNTNGTHFPEHAVEIWQHFRTVEIAISIDDIGERFEYQRTNAVWSEVQENIARFHSLRNSHANIQLQCCSTVNIFNIRYIDQLARWITSQQFDFVYWNIMHDAWYFSIATLPDAVKEDIDMYLSSARIPERFRKDFEGIRDFMNNGASTDGFMMRMKIADLDRKRNQDFAQVSPEMAELIEYVKA